MAKTVAGKAWGNVQSNALDKPDWPYLDPTKSAFEAYGPALAVSFSSVANTGVFTPDTTLVVTTVLANSGLVIIEGTPYTINVVNSSSFTVTADAATPGYANAHVYPDASVTHQHIAETPAGANANVYATSQGWARQAPGANAEILVSLGGLKMPSVTMLTITDESGVVGHSNSEIIQLRMQLSSGVNPPDNTANVWLLMIGNANTANQNIAYSAALSSPEKGVLVFRSTVDLSLETAADTLTVNSTSTFHGAANLYVRRQKGTPVAASTVLSGNTVITLA